MLSLSLLLALLALGFTIGAIVGKVPLWIAVLLLSLAQLVTFVPLAR